MKIDYNIIANSIKHYENLGFKQIVTPWIVDQEISNVTKPVGGKDFPIGKTGRVLVASGEQSFLQKFVFGQLENGIYQTVTPCFRKDDPDDLHVSEFIKNELIITKNVNYETLDFTINAAEQFFSRYLIGIEVVKTEESETSHDIMCNEIELGSYGIRNYKEFRWVYGTGVAEPRLSTVIEKEKYGRNF